MILLVTTLSGLIGVVFACFLESKIGYKLGHRAVLFMILAFLGMGCGVADCLKYFIN